MTFNSKELVRTKSLKYSLKSIYQIISKIIFNYNSKYEQDLNKLIYKR